MPVSAGVVRGPVRLIHTVDDAESLKPGEIMVASFTDIGWTPYYGIAGGLVTLSLIPISEPTRPY